MGDWTDFLIAVPAVVNLLFAFAFGASAGSFMHVLVHRMPQGLSVISPPSRCPTCGHRLRWHENIPVISWLRLRGRCAACGTGIPARYLWSEVGMGALFALAYAVLFLPRPGSFWCPVGEGWWRAQGAAASLPGLLAVWAGLGALVAMTIVDARSFLIPVAIPSWTTVLAFVLWPLAALSSRQVPHPFPLAAPAWPVCVAAMGGLAGLGIGWSLLRAGVLPRSFEDYSDYAEDESDVFADYPHARREMIKELAFVGPAVLLAAVGYAVAPHLPMAGPPPAPLAAFFAVATGFLVGGAVVWALRIVASLLLDTEALGLGDVHLLASVGAVFGWRVAVVAFVAAPFLGLGWWIANLARRAPTRMPYGPALAVGAVAAWGLRPVLSSAVAGCMAAMASIGDEARSAPGESLGVAVVFGIAAVGMARLTRRIGGPGAAMSILMMLAAVLAWILAAPSRSGAGVVVGLALAVGCVLGSFLAGPGQEDGPGPRTALARILRMMAVTVLAAMVLFAVVRPRPTLGEGGIGGTDPEEIAPAPPLQDPSGRVE
jgi:leader peptidase (prepilin peptidase)/N-methyltransferase